MLCFYEKCMLTHTQTVYSISYQTPASLRLNMYNSYHFTMPWIKILHCSTGQSFLKFMEAKWSVLAGIFIMSFILCGGETVRRTKSSLKIKKLLNCLIDIWGHIKALPLFPLCPQHISDHLITTPCLDFHMNSATIKTMFSSPSFAAAVQHFLVSCMVMPLWIC